MVSKAVILAAGEGKRLRPFTEDMPKVMLPVANKPILEYVVDALVKNGIRDIVMVVGYRKESVMSHFEDGKKFGAHIQYVEQEKQIGTGHALFQAEKYIEDEFIVLPGDNIIDKKSVGELKKCKSPALIVEENPTPSKYGVVEIEEGKVKGIVEKPEKAEVNLISTGIYKFMPSIFDALKECMKDGKNNLTDVVQLLISRGEEISAVEGSGEWKDIVYPWNLLEINAKALQNITPSTAGKIEKNVVIKGNVYVGRDTIIHSGCYIVGPVIIGEGCEIGPNSCIFPSTSIGDNVTIYPFCEIRNSVIMESVAIGSHSYVSQSIISKGTRISSHFSATSGGSIIEIEDEFHRVKAGAFIGADCEIGEHVIIEPGRSIGKNCIISPFNKINKNVDSMSKVM